MRMAFGFAVLFFVTVAYLVGRSTAPRTQIITHKDTIVEDWLITSIEIQDERLRRIEALIEEGCHDAEAANPAASD